jgi:hypothetical protein
MNQRIMRLGLAAVSSLLVFSGCSSHRQLATQAVDFNLTVEKAQNEMLLLNVIRAKDRLPMYMTGISSLSGNLSTSLSAGSTISTSHSREREPTVVDTLTRGATASLGTAVSANPSFSLAVLDTQEFMRGFLTPIPMDILGYYWSQEWPRALLLYLLVQRVEIEFQGGGTQVLRNYPNSASTELRDLKTFGCTLRDFLARNPRFETKSLTQDIGPPLSRDEVSDVTKLIQVGKDGYGLSQDTEKGFYQLTKTRTEQHFALNDKPAYKRNSTDFPNAEYQKSCEDADPISASAPPSSDAKTGEPAGEPEPYQQSAAAGKIRVPLAGSKSLTLVLRSPEALLYYLGELARVANRKESPKMPYICIQNRFQPLFVALPSGRCQGSQVEVNGAGGKFSVPAASEDSIAKSYCDEGDIRIDDANKCDAGRSMQALRLVSQIMSMQKYAKDLPSAGVVRLLN